MGVDYKNLPDYLLQRLCDAHNPKKARIRAKFFEKEFEFFSKHIRDQNVLVAGSGFGHDSFELAKYNKLVLGVELHPTLVEYSKKNAQRLGFSNINFEQGDITNLRFKKNTFDSAVLNMGTIGNFDDK
ncbi:class I SAM-dependent methyltransferase [Candidatus Woesearchaeota archaeon]|nr:class I SAM-dependent methyltransferase [Candidatus Woesearchaeota archaeon]